MLSRSVTDFLPRSKHLLISWLQSSSAVILEPKKIKFVTVSIEMAVGISGNEVSASFPWSLFPSSWCRFPWQQQWTAARHSSRLRRALSLVSCGYHVFLTQSFFIRCSKTPLRAQEASLATRALPSLAEFITERSCRGSVLHKATGTLAVEIKAIIFLCSLFSWRH